MRPNTGPYKRTAATAAAARTYESALERSRYRLQREQFDTDGGARWVTLRAHETVDPLLEKAPELAGHVRIVGRKGQEVARWCDGALQTGGEVQRAK